MPSFYYPARPRRRPVAWVLLLLLLFVCAGAPAHARQRSRTLCNLRILSAYPCDSQAQPYTPAIGETYFFRVNFSVTGKIQRGYKIQFRMLNQTWNWTAPPTQAGRNYYGYAGFSLPYGEEVRYSVVLDPERVSGDTDRSDNTFVGAFTPRPPTAAIEYYEPRQWRGQETVRIEFEPGSGSISNGYQIMGRPTTGTFQTILSSTATAGATSVVTQPNGQPIWEFARGPLTPTAANKTWLMSQEFTTEAKNVRVNPALLEQVTWNQMDAAALPADVRSYLAADPLAQTSSPAVTSFVSRSLPTNYRTTLSPYRTARSLFLATVKEITYETPWVELSASGVLTRKKGDCGGFSNVFVASCRSVGIPARLISGWWSGTNVWHVMAEFYLPGRGWVQADGSTADGIDPTGTYPYVFGNMYNLNSFCAVGRGADYRTSYAQMDLMQTGWFWYWGTARYSLFSTTASLDPL